MKYRISIISKIKSNDEDIITRKYLQRIKNIELKQYEIKTKNKVKKLDEEGENMSSVDLAKLILNWSKNNIKSVNFAIGGAFGNGMKIKKTADKIIAFGKLTWPHQMVKMMIAEQIYRIESIIQGHPYHK